MIDLRWHATSSTLTIPPAVLGAIARCVETATALDTVMATGPKVEHASWNEEQAYGERFSSAQKADDEATHELGAACWEWFKREGVVMDVERSRAAPASAPPTVYQIDRAAESLGALRVATSRLGPVAFRVDVAGLDGEQRESLRLRLTEAFKGSRFCVEERSAP
jgi:hypothetical protein